MNKWIFVISAILVSLLVFGLSIESMSNYEKENVLNNITDIMLIDKHKVANNEGDYSTLGNVTIIDTNTIQITFNNKNNFGLWHKDVKIWSIPGDFEFVKEVKTGQKFITNCIANEEGRLNVDVFELESVDMSNDDVIFNHYVGQLSNNAECIYPEIIEQSFDIKWD